MRRKLYILLILLDSVLRVSAGLTPEEQTLRDSIFKIYHNMPADTVRVEYLRDMYQQNIRADWSIELVDSALKAARTLGNGRLELMLSHEVFRYSQYRGDLPEMERRLAVLKECYYRQKSYEYYFSAWEAALDLQCSRGNIEYAILQAKQMKGDAEELGYEKGICTPYYNIGIYCPYSVFPFFAEERRSRDPCSK